MVKPGGGVLALIPARGGSKSLPRKNIRLLAGRPLIAHSIEAALASATVDRVVVSTDDPEIAEVGRQHGAEVPFLRPADLAEDDTPDLPVFQHALRWLEEKEGWTADIVVQLRPTSPLRRPEDVDRAVAILRSRPEVDAVRSVAEPYENPYKMWQLGPGGWLVPLVPTDLPEPYNMPRQHLPDAWWQTGAIDAARRRTILDLGSMTGERIAPLVVEAFGPVDIDTQASLDLVDWMIRSGRVPWMGTGSTDDPSLLPPSARRPTLLVLDFDGVLTDNRVWVDQNGTESSVFDRGDGMGIRLLRDAGVEILVLSTEENPIVAARCAKLQIPCRQGLADKRAALLEWTSEHGVDLSAVAYVGNDVNDIGCFEVVGLAIAVGDAHPDVHAHVDARLTRPGGSGAVREACDALLRLPV
jgi:YrbI family 3-deoxy-D-manno-octulosonate 8-phosphate phosphatase